MRKPSIIVTIFLLFLIILPAQADRLGHTGKISRLRVNETGIPFGGGQNRIDAEVVIGFLNKNGYHFGFKMRADNRLPAREGMLSLLRDAFNHGWRVQITYDIRSGSNNGTIVQVTVLR